MPLPFHPRAVPAAELAREARVQKGEVGFWAAHDALLDAYPKLEDADLDAVAGKVGIDAAKVREAIRTHRHKAKLDADIDLADDFEVSSTPHFFINGRRLVGTQTALKFEDLINEEMRRAQAKLASGTTPAALYDALIRDGRSVPEVETKLVALPATAPSKGNAAAKVVIQEFADFQSPFSARVEDALKEVMQRYGTQVRLVWRHLPLPMHVNAMLAAEASAEAQRQKGNDGFFKMHGKLLQNQAAPGGLERTALDGYAREIGLDTAAFANALDQHTHKAKIELDAKAANDAGISGVPAFVIGGYFLSGAQPASKFRKIIDRVLQSGPAKFAPAGTLGIVDLKVGTGAPVVAGDTVSVHYVGTLTNGTEFDSSRKHMQPFKFKVGGGQVIKGWEQGLLGMRLGGRRKLTIPPALGYGERGTGPIPPNSTLIFEIELISIP